MPMYDFACRECGQVFEKKLRMSQSSDPQACPSCGSGDTRRHMSSAIAIGGGGSSVAPAIATRPPSSPFT
ncbi:MAG: zinc ribbon domain-containing protein [Ardenticatenaceae bacterium]|nr:zinc ribbon domain-containing protein [Anaerolineales bacterium]MCB8941776.1 zinc ribbon domain-containing protein [Ardenticatenaceae bacterium]MCB8972887.1 zinc ribbon domain-containing protein [Ardenticatenaceae bacterium]